MRLELLSVLWIVTETVLSMMAAWSVGSLAISAFGVDSAIELVSGLVLLLRLLVEVLTGRSDVTWVSERIASLVVGLCLCALAAFISFKSGQAFAARQPIDVSWLGFTVAGLSAVITPWLARQKHKLGRRLHSHALLGDAACSMTCAYMAWTLLLGLTLQWAFGWWWLDALAALGIVYFVLREALESLHSAWTGQVHIH